jgi:hypothetical protein
VKISYSWVKGDPARGGDGGQETASTECIASCVRDALLGMLLHIDSSEHRWFQDERRYDLLIQRLRALGMLKRIGPFFRRPLTLFRYASLFPLARRFA